MLEEHLQRANNIIQTADSIWIFVPTYASLDHVCASVVLAQVLSRRGKRVKLVCQRVDESWLRFVPEIQILSAGFELSFGSAITLPPSVLAGGVSLVKEGGSQVVRITGIRLSEPDVKISHWSESCDLAVIAGISRRRDFVQEFGGYQNALEHASVLTIDPQVASETWGEVNVLSARASGVSELTAYLIRAAAPQERLTPREATLLYMGIIDATRGFSIRNQNPQTYLLVSELLSLGADNAQLIQQFYFSKTLSELRVWGRALARLERDAYRRFVWSRISNVDLEKTGSNPTEARTVLGEMMTQTPEADVVCLFLEHQGKVEVGVRNKLGGFSLEETFWKYSPLGGNERMFFMVSGSLIEVERTVLEELALAWDRLHPR